MLSEEEKRFLEALSDFIHDRDSKSVDYRTLDEKQLIAIAMRHKCESIVYKQLKAPHLHRVFATNCYFAINRQSALEEVHSEFLHHGIRYVLLKGAAIAPLYPIPELRAMADGDILIHKEDRARANRVLSKLDFTCHSRSKNAWLYERGGVQLELHFTMLSDELAYTAEETAFCYDVWHFAHTKDGALYSLEYHYHLLALIIFLKSCFLGGGVGIKLFTDLAVLSQRKQIDWAFVEEKAKELQVDAFAGICFAFLNYWFAIEVPFPSPVLDDTFAKEGTEAVLASGILPQKAAKGGKSHFFSRKNRKAPVQYSEKTVAFLKKWGICI